MAINRGPWSALVDDDGSNLVGSIWNKAAIATVLLDPIDAMTANNVTTTATGTVDNLACGPASAITVIRCRNTAPLTITGLAFTTTPRDGDLAFIEARAAGHVYLAQDAAGSTQRFANFATSAPTPLAGGAPGRAIYVFEAVSNYWILHAHEQGAPIVIPFVAGNYTGQGAITAGMVKLHEYYLKGRMLTGTIQIEAFPNAASTQLLVAGWPSFVPTVIGRYIPGIGTINGPWGQVSGAVNPANIAFNRNDFGNYPAGPHYVNWQGTWAVN